MGIVGAIKKMKKAIKKPNYDEYTRFILVHGAVKDFKLKRGIRPALLMPATIDGDTQSVEVWVDGKLVGQLFADEFQRYIRQYGTASVEVKALVGNYSILLKGSVFGE